MADELPPVIQAANRFRDALLRGERDAAVRLIRAYGLAYQRLQGDIDALLEVIASMPKPTWREIEQLGLYRSLLGDIREQIGRFAVIAENDLNEGARAAILAGLSDSERLVQAALPGLEAATIRAAWVRLSPGQVETIMGFLQEDSPLFQNLRLLGDDVADLVANELRIGIILGRNPRVIAEAIRNATGQGLTWSLNMSRTSQLWAYREASRANFLSNSHIVKGWQWWSQLGDPRTCLSCTVMHGTIHSLDEPLNDHHQGRCSMLPITLTYAELGLNVPEDRQPVQSGIDWFGTLSPVEQRNLMGGARYAAWQAGEFELPALSQPYQNDVYGEMLREASLKGLLGDRARQYYGR